MIIPAERETEERADFFTTALLAAGTVAYLALFPRSLGGADEGIFLYEAKRILDGDVFYRDIFDIITPGSHYAMAAVFGLFGTNILSARIATAILHAAIVVLVYVTCRTLHVRRTVALVAALFHVALGQPAWPYASPHWFSTALASLLLLVALRPQALARWRGALWLGLIVGAMIMVQQQKGVVLLPAAVVLIGLPTLLEGRWKGIGTGSQPRLVARLACLGAGVAIVVLPSFLSLIALSGFAPVFRALVEHPLANYHEINPVGGWGSVGALTGPHARSTFPRLLACLPAFLLPTIIRAARNWVTRQRVDETQSLLTLLVVSAFSIVSIAYHPDFIHIAFIAPILVVPIAENAEWALRKLEQRRARTAVAGAAVAAALMIGLSVWMARNLTRAHRAFPISYETAFGRVDLANDRLVKVLAGIDTILAGEPSRTMFSYPYYPALYLLAGANNPTPYQILQPPYNQPDQIRQVIDIVDARQVPLIFVLPLFAKDSDTFVKYMREKYSPSPQHPLLWIRKPAAGPRDGADRAESRRNGSAVVSLRLPT